VTMILPERTVDAWTATYITGRRWRARLWAPTERGSSERYDLGVGLGSVGGVPVPAHPDVWPDKVFVFEHKGVDEGAGAAPIVWIRVRQLLAHLFEDRARGGNLVYYLLPDPEWMTPKAAPYGTVPDVAWRRTRGPKLPTGGYAWDGFQGWARIAHAEDVLRRLLQVHKSAPSRFKLRPGRRKGEPDWACALSMPEVRDLRNQVSLRDFVSAVRRCTHGRLASDESLRGSAPSIPPFNSLDEALALAAESAPMGEKRPEEVDDVSQRETSEKVDPPQDEGDLAEIFERGSFTTVYGIGDSLRSSVEGAPSSLF
jgi:hypothetical protein